MSHPIWESQYTPKTLKSEHRKRDLIGPIVGGQLKLDRLRYHHSKLLLKEECWNLFI